MDEDPVQQLIARVEAAADAAQAAVTAQIPALSSFAQPESLEPETVTIVEGVNPVPSGSSCPIQSVTSSTPIGTEESGAAPQRDSQGFAIPTGRPIPQDLAYVMQFAQEIGQMAIAGPSSSTQPATAEVVDVTKGEGSTEMETEEDSEASSSDESMDSSDDSDSDDSSDDEDSRPSLSTPMTAAQRNSFLAQLSSFGAGAGVPTQMTGVDEDGNEVGYITESSEEGLDEDESDDEMDVVPRAVRAADEEEEEIEIEGLFDSGALSSSSSESKRKLKTTAPKAQTVGGVAGAQNKGKGKATTDNDSDSDSDEEDDDAGSMIDIKDIEDDDEDEGPVSTAPPLTKNEIATEPLKIPPVTRLPVGERLVYAGEVLRATLDKGIYDAVLAAEMATAVAEQQVKVEALGVNQSETPETTVDGAPGVNTEIPEISSTVAVTESSAENGREEGEIEDEKPDADILNAADAKAWRGKANPKPKPTASAKALSKPAGTVIIRATRAEVGGGFGKLQRGDQDGWLEEDSLICFSDGRVIAHVAETFGPTSAPFYLLRLPPPPYPLPTAESLQAGTKLYYPVNRYRSFVPVQMLATDKRFKGTDASNLFDEEPAQEEIDYSDDEAEAMAKVARKRGKQNSRAPHSGIPAPSERGRHHDAPPKTAEMGDSEYLDYKHGAPGENDWENLSDDGGAAPPSEFGGGGSIASTSSVFGRAAPAPYEDVYPAASSAMRPTHGSGGERGGRDDRGRGRGRGQDRGRGRGDARGGRGGTRGNDRGRGRGQGQDRPRGGGHPYSPPSGRDQPQRNFDGNRNIGRGAGRGRGSDGPQRGGRGGGRGGGPPLQDRRNDRAQSPTSMAIARAMDNPHPPPGTMQQGGSGMAMPMMGMPFMGMPMMMPGLGGGMPFGYGAQPGSQGNNFGTYGYGQPGQMGNSVMHMGMQMGGAGMNMGMQMGGGMGPPSGPGQMGMGGFGPQQGMGAINPRFAAQFGVPMGGTGANQSGDGQSSAGQRFEHVD